MIYAKNISAENETLGLIYISKLKIPADLELMIWVLRERGYVYISIFDGVCTPQDSGN